MRRPLLFFSLSCCLSATAIAQPNQTSPWHASIGVQGIATNKDNVPFWMRSMQYGSVPLPGASGSFIGAARKDYDPNAGLADWGGAIEIRADVGDSSRLTLIQGYIKARFSIFEFKAGRSREFTGLVDSTLSSGAYSISGNALGIPKVQLAIPEYFPLPIFGGLFAFKGTFSYGWLGNEPLQYTQYASNVKGNYHELSFYGRLGKPNWRLKLYGGLNHQAMWGDEKTVYGPHYQISKVKEFEYVVLGKTYLGSKIGNHIGSIDMGLDYDLGGARLSFYRQNFYDEGALSKLANIADGLNGISLTNTKDVDQGDVPDYYPVLGSPNSGFHWRKIVLEVFYSKNQAGYPWSKPTNSGDENYYNNFEYYNGWSYKGLGLGNPFVTPAYTTRKGLPNSRGDYFNNNRVMAFYGAIQAVAGDYSFTAKGSYSMNYGTFGTSPWGHTTGSPANYTPVPKYNWFPEAKQFSAYLDVTRRLEEGWTVGCTAAFDRGDLFYNSYGLILSVKKDL